MDSNDKKDTQSKLYAQPKRPQEPRRPYPYHEEEVYYENKVAGVTLAGTLTIPQGSGPFPAVILIAGASKYTRDENICGHKLLLVLADHLTRQGIAVLRFDKRGCGTSTGNFEMATSVDFAHDVQAGIEYLKSRKEINTKQIGLVGHSEGALVAPIVANSTEDVAFMVMLGGLGVNGKEIIYESCAIMGQFLGESEETVTRRYKLLSQLFAVIEKETDEKRAWEKIVATQIEYLAKLSEVQKREIEPMVNDILGLMSRYPWFRFFLTFEPTSALKKIQIPVLALFGERDLEVPPKQNFLPIVKALKTADNNDYTALQIPRLNHLFQHCKTGTESEYAEIEETMASEVLSTISDWIVIRTIKK